MSTTLNGNINIQVLINVSKDGSRGNSYIRDNNIFQNGTGAGQADKNYYGKLTVAASGSPQDLDFAGGGLIDRNGDTITWAEMPGLIIAAPDTNTVDVLVGAHPSAAFDFGCGTATAIHVKPGEVKILVNSPADGAYPVVAGTGDTLRLAIPSGTNQVLEVLSLGRSS